MSRLIKLGIAGVLTLLSCPWCAYGQEPEAPLGDVARLYRKGGSDRPVIDNDNLPVMMDKAEAERLNGKPVFSIDPSGKTFRVTSPDGSCSLSFDAKAAALITTPRTFSALPLDDLGRLDGTASIHDGVIDVQLQNGTEWDLKEIVVGVTLLNERASLMKSVNLLGPTDGMLLPKTPDVTMLYHLKATTLPDGTTVFRGTLDQDLGPTTDWHWALVGAKGVPPAPPSSIAVPAQAGLAPLPGLIRPQNQPLAEANRPSSAPPADAVDSKP